MSTTDQAICLRTADYSETSQVVHLLTRGGGVVRLLAKGSKRPKSKSGGRIDLFSEGRCVFAGKSGSALGTLMEFSEMTSHSPLRRDLRRLNAGLFMLEACAALLGEGDPQPETFDLLHSVLARLGQADASPAAVLAYFQYRMLKLVGLLGDLEACTGCGAKVTLGATYFSSSAGGLLCRNCEPAATEKYAVTSPAMAGLAVLAAARAGKRPAFPDVQADAVNALLAYHLQYQLGRRLKTARGVLRSPRR